MARGKTMKKSKLMSFPQLRGAFETVNMKAKELLKGGNPSKITGRFQNIWQQTFGKPISPKAALAYLSMTKKGQHGGSLPPMAAIPQMGGAMLSPASANFDDGQLRPGASFPPVLTPQGALVQQYINNPGYPGTNMPSPSFPSAHSCSMMKGGRRSRRKTRGRRTSTRRKQMGGGQYVPSPADFASSFIAHPYISQNPSGTLGDMSRMFNGQHINPSMDATRVTPPYLSYTAGNMSIIPMAKFDGSSFLSTSGPK